MKLFIPTIGTKLKLTKPWEFTLYNEYRNDSMWYFYGFEDFLQGHPHWGRRNGYTGESSSVSCDNTLRTNMVTLPKGSILTLDRIYIRKGNAKMKEFDSASFRITFPDGTSNHKRDSSYYSSKVGDYIQKERKERLRFWAKLYDVNNIYCIIMEDE